MIKGIKKRSIALLAIVTFLCAALSAVFLSPNVFGVIAAEGTTPTFSTTKYQISSDEQYLLLVTGIKDFDDVYEVGYKFFDEEDNDISADVTKDGNVVTDKYFTSVKSGEKTWTAEELFDAGYAGMIVWEIKYDSSKDYTYQAYAKVGDRDGGGLVTSDRIVYGTKADILSVVYNPLTPESTTDALVYKNWYFNTYAKDGNTELKQNYDLNGQVDDYMMYPIYTGYAGMILKTTKTFKGLQKLKEAGYSELKFNLYIDYNKVGDPSYNNKNCRTMVERGSVNGNTSFNVNHNEFTTVSIPIDQIINNYEKIQNGTMAILFVNSADSVDGPENGLNSVHFYISNLKFVKPDVAA